MSRAYREHVDSREAYIEPDWQQWEAWLDGTVGIEDTNDELQRLAIEESGVVYE